MQVMIRLVQNSFLDKSVEVTSYADALGTLSRRRALLSAVDDDVDTDPSPRSPDFRWAELNGKEYTLNDKQASVLRILTEACATSVASPRKT
jgi:hypothetical protein